MNGMDNLIEFLRACLDDDERVAREITAPEWSEGCSWLADLRDPLPSQRRAYGLSKEYSLLSEADTKHIARWDPARVLAEISAKRQIVDECAYALAKSAPRSTLNDFAWTVLRPLAQPYAGRPGWREQWRAEQR